MSPGIAKDLHEQVGAAIDHRRMIRKVWRGVHHRQQLYDPPYPTQLPKLVLEPGDLNEADRAGCFVAFVNTQVAAKFACEHIIASRNRGPSA